MSKITDKELRELTIKLMEKTTKHYLNTYESKESDNINKLIERDVAMRIVAIVPDRYTEITVNVINFFGDIEIATVFKTDAGYKLCVDYEYVVPYDPTSLTETYYFGNKTGRGSKVETLPEAPWAPKAGTKRGIVDRLMNESISLGVSSRGNRHDAAWASIFMQAPLKSHSGRIVTAPPTDWGTMTKKTPVGSEKATVDFSKLSLLSPPDANIPRAPVSTWYGVDLATVDVKQECIDQAAKEIRNRIAREILESIRIAAAKDDMKWAVPTFGWSEEVTKWQAPEAISWKTRASMLGYSVSPSEFGGVITTAAAEAAVWHEPDTSILREMVEFTEADLDLIKPCESEVMKFA